VDSEIVLEGPDSKSASCCPPLETDEIKQTLKSPLVVSGIPEQIKSGKYIQCRHETSEGTACRVGSWLMPIVIGGIDVECVVDSGAATTMIDIDTWRAVKNKPTLQQTDSIVLRDAQNNRIPVLGVANFTVHIGPWSGKHTFVVCDTPGTCRILGMDFMQMHCSLADIATGRFAFYGLDETIALYNPGQFPP
jgi:hypothetical protein